MKPVKDEATIGTRHNAGKPPFSILLEAHNAVEGVSKVLEFGSIKYDRGNWRNGLHHTKICDSLLRHLSLYLSGEDFDEESNLPHVHHVACNAIFLAEMIATHPHLDDRAKVNYNVKGSEES